MNERIGHYTIIGPLGEGAMGTVYRGIDEKLNMEVAIKVLSREIASQPKNIARFEREARAAANLKHPNIAHVFFVGRDEGDLPFYAMEFIDGPSLDDVIEKRMRVRGRQMLAIMQQSAAALQFATDKGVLHRDVKPGNIMISRESGVKLVDFGIAKVSETDASLTTTGVVLGTPNYLSPEQANGDKADFRSDMYSLGVTFFQLLAGRLPYSADTPVAVIMKHAQEPIPDLHAMNAQFPRHMCRAIERMLSKEPAGRYGSYAELIAELDQIPAREAEFTSGEWTFCEQCGVNVLLKDGSRCGRCGAAIGPSLGEEIYMAARLTSFSSEDARHKVVQYMQSTTGRPAEIVDRMLKSLPLNLSLRMPFEKAKALQRRMYDMGAEVTLQRVGSEKVRVGSERQVLDMGPADGHARAKPAPAADRPPAAGGRGRLIFEAGVLAVAAAIAAIHFWPRAAEPPRPRPLVQAAAKTSSEDPAAYLSPSGGCRIRVAGIKDETLPAALGRVCEENLSRIKKAVDAPELPKFQFKVDGKRDFVLMAPLFGLSIPPGDGEITLYGRQLRPDAAETRAVMAALMARQIVREAGGGTLPRWLEAGFALSVMNRVVPGAYDPSKVLAGADRYLEDDVLDEAFLENNPLAYAQSASFMDYLIKKAQPGSAIELARRLKDKTPLDKAFLSIYGLDRPELMKSWFDQSKAQ
jgi:serine/threonine protein kinase